MLSEDQLGWRNGIHTRSTEVGCLRLLLLYSWGLEAGLKPVAADRYRRLDGQDTAPPFVFAETRNIEFIQRSSLSRTKTLGLRNVKIGGWYLRNVVLPWGIEERRHI